MHFALISAADYTATPDQNRAQGDEQMQTELFQLLLSDISPPKIELMSQRKPYSDLCNWGTGFLGHGRTFRVRCNGEVLESLTMMRIRGENLHLDFMPSTVRYMQIQYCEQRYTVETRRLPRMAEQVHISNNYIYGTIDLRALPENLEHFNASANAIIGPIILSHLPVKLTLLNLSSNQIRQRVVHFHHIPRTLRTVDMQNNSIKAVRPLNHGSGCLGSTHFRGDFRLAEEFEE